MSVTLTTVTRPSLVTGSVGMEKRPVGSPAMIRYTAFQAGVPGSSLSVTVRFVTITFTRFSGTSPWNYRDRQKEIAFQQRWLWREACSSVCVCVTHSLSGELWSVVIDIQQAYDSSGGIGQTIRGVSLHVGSLNDQGVLRHLLLATKNETR